LRSSFEHGKLFRCLEAFLDTRQNHGSFPYQLWWISLQKLSESSILQLSAALFFSLARCADSAVLLGCGNRERIRKLENSLKSMEDGECSRVFQFDSQLLLSKPQEKETVAFSSEDRGS
jgi:hypothetical protein